MISELNEKRIFINILTKSHYLDHTSEIGQSWWDAGPCIWNIFLKKIPNNENNGGRERENLLSPYWAWRRSGPHKWAGASITEQCGAVKCGDRTWQMFRTRPRDDDALCSFDPQEDFRLNGFTEIWTILGSGIHLWDKHQLSSFDRDVCHGGTRDSRIFLPCSSAPAWRRHKPRSR